MSVGVACRLCLADLYATFLKIKEPETSVLE